jgi:murein DD-endopeptidase MepM/ murein hydrolase activator NlpD
MVSFIFPHRQRPNLDYHTYARNFGAPRSGGTRKHAGCDLIAPKGTEILAMADGQVIQGPYYFYEGTYALEVKHDNGMFILYCDISLVVHSGI